MLCRGERPHERLEHAWVESAIDALVGGMDGMGSTPAGVQRPRAVGKPSRVLAVCTQYFECGLEYQCRREFRSEERRVGKEWVSTGRCGGAAHASKKKEI